MLTRTFVRRWVVPAWPGLSAAWYRGDLPSLVVALAFGALLECALLTTFIWPEMTALWLTVVVWLSVVGVWLYVAAPYFVSGGVDDDGFADNADLFLIAQMEYLKGNWHQAESALAGLLARDRFDADARLTLATLYRHTGRLDEARHQMDLLEESDGATKWQVEIQSERRRLLESHESPEFDTERQTRNVA